MWVNLICKKIIKYKNYCFYTLLNTFFKRFLNSKVLFSNGCPFNLDSNCYSRLESFSSNTDPKILKEFIEENGYLWVKNFFDREYIYSLENKCKISLGLNKNCFFLSPAYHYEIDRKTVSLLQSDFYLKFAESTSIQKFLTNVFGFEPKIAKRKLIRIKLPSSPFSTGAHYDFNYIRKSKGSGYTMWIPLGDIPADGGGITYLANSRAIAHNIEDRIAKQNSSELKDPEINAYSSHFDRDGWITKNLMYLAKIHNLKWLIGDFEAGDLVIHDSFLIHASSQNTNKDKMPRISTDIRFAPSLSHIDNRWDSLWNAADGL